MKPVFVDRSGRRRRAVRLAGAAAGLGLALAAALLVAGFTGAGPGHVPPLPDPVGGREGAATTPAPKVTRTSAAPVRPSPRPVSGTPSRTAAPAVTATTASATPAPNGSAHRRVPTHTPGNKPSKPS